jgi:hypothetical protein
MVVGTLPVTGSCVTRAVARCRVLPDPRGVRGRGAQHILGTTRNLWQKMAIPTELLYSRTRLFADLPAQC